MSTSNKLEVKFEEGERTEKGVSGSVKAEASVGMSTNPLNFFSAKGSVTGVATAEGSKRFYTNIDTSSSNVSSWSKNQQQSASSLHEVITSYSQHTTASNFHLVFTVTFYNNSDHDYEIIPKSLPISAGGDHLVDATASTGETTIIIPANRAEGVDIAFRANLDSTHALKLVGHIKKSAPDIRIERSQMKITSVVSGVDAVGARSRIATKTIPFQISNGDVSIKLCVANKVGGHSVLFRDAIELPQISSQRVS